MKRFMLSLKKTTSLVFIFIIVTLAGKGQTDTSHGVINMVVSTKAIWLGNKPDTTLSFGSDQNFSYVAPNGDIYFINSSNQLNKLNPSTRKVTLIAGNGIYGFSGDSGLATKASLGNSIQGIVVDKVGNIFISDWSNFRVRRIDAVTGIITTVAGNGSTYTRKDSVPATSTYIQPMGLFVDTIGNLYINDSDPDSGVYNNGTIRRPYINVLKVSAATGIITRVAGNGTDGDSGDGGLATKASINGLVAVDLQGNLYILGNNTIRKVTASTGIINTIIGNGTAGFSGDGGPALLAELNDIQGVLCDKLGNVFVCDGINNRIRKIDKSGIISTIFGNGDINSFNGGVGGFAKEPDLIYLWFPQGVWIDSANNLYEENRDYLNQYYNIGRITWASPILTSFTPLSAVVGDTVIIRGQAFIGATSVSFGGKSAYSYTVINDSTIYAVLSNCNSGKVIVTTPNGSDSMDGFRYIPPVITSFSPTIACAGTIINIKGKNFTGSTSVSFGGKNASSFKVNSDTSITAVIDSGATGRIAVTTPVATGTSNYIFSLGSKTTAFAYVANSSDNTVSVINTETDSVVDIITVGQRPLSVCTSLNGKNVYVANGDSSVSIIATETNSVIKTLYLGFSPYSVSTNRTGKEIYVTNVSGYSLGKINVQTNSLVPAKHFQGVYMNANVLNYSPDNKVYVPSPYFGLLVLNPLSDSIVGLVPNIYNPISSCMSPDQSSVFVTSNCFDCNNLGIVNTTLDTATRSILVGQYPTGICISPDGTRLYVANSGDNTLNVINTITDSVIGTIYIGIAGSQGSPQGVSITPDGKKVYVVNEFSNSVSVISTETNSIINTISVGANPISMGNFIANVVTPCGTLAVRVLNVSAKNINGTSLIRWQTSTELNTSHFIIQHSTDGSSFTDIGTVKAIGIGAKGYSFTDNNPTNGVNYYRLKSVDKDESFTYSKVVSVQLTVNSNQLAVFPNPSKDVVTVSGKHITSVQVVDNLGRVIKVVSLKDATNPTISVSSLPVGIYHLRIQTTDGKINGVGFVKE